MERVLFLIDGFNLYHSLAEKYRRYLWLDLSKYADCYTTKKQKIIGVRYFTALAWWLRDAQDRHKRYIRALEANGVDVVYGLFKKKERTCRVCGSVYDSHEEKRTDVNIGVHLVRGAFLNEYDTAILVTTDTDQVPSIEIVKQAFPRKKVGVLFPIERHASELKQAADFTRRTKQNQLQSSQLPSPLVIPGGVTLHRPSSWN